jgi:hypothetical protein
VGARSWKLLVPPHLAIGILVSDRFVCLFFFVCFEISSLSFEILVFGTYLVNFELRDRHGDVGHNLLVRDAPSFNQKSDFDPLLVNLLHLYAFQKSWCFSLISMFWPFLGVPVPTMTSASKNQYDRPDFEFIYHTLMPLMHGQRFFSLTKDNSCPRNFLEKTYEHIPFRMRIS